MVLPDVPYRVRLRPRTLHKEIWSLTFIRLFLQRDTTDYLPLWITQGLFAWGWVTVLHSANTHTHTHTHILQQLLGILSTGSSSALSLILPLAKTQVLTSPSFPQIPICPVTTASVVQNDLSISCYERHTGGALIQECWKNLLITRYTSCCWMRALVTELALFFWQWELQCGKWWV